MSTETIARRYSSALADVVIKTGETDAVRSELKTWDEIIASSANLTNVFGNPAIDQSKKIGLLEGLIGKARPTKTTANFLRVLLKNNRLNDLSEINERFATVIEQRSGLTQAFISSAHELSDDQKASLEKMLAKGTGGTIKLNFSIDPDLIGGVVARVGSTVYDGSVRTQLEKLKEQLMQK